MFVWDSFIQNGRGVGEVGAGLQNVRYDPGYLRPYINRRGDRCVTLNSGKHKYSVEHGRDMPVFQSYRIADLQARGINHPVFNATALRKEEWLQLDQVVLRAARFRLRFWQDLSAANSFGGFNGMSKMILEHETMSDPGEAVVDMTGVTEGNRNDKPLFQLEGLPLPITHCDFTIDSRTLAVSRNTGTPLDTTLGEAGGRRIGERVEKTAIGVNTGVIYGGNSTQVGGYGRTSQVYGLTNFPNRLTKTNLTTPTGSNPQATVADVLAMRDQLYLNKFYGPFMLYHSNDWDQYMDNDYARAVVGSTSVATNMTLRDRLRAIEGIQDVRRLDFLFGSTSGTDSSHGPGGDVDVSLKPFRLIMVQMTPDVARAVNGMDITTVQWETKGGMELNFKIMCIQVPQLRADYYGNCGILDATTS